MSNRRALHFVFKVGNRNDTVTFYKDVLGMKILRHEEFEEGCKASCNGPYDGKWSKSMVGYGSEDDHFVVELTYNYGIGRYKLGNDFQGLTISSDEVLERAKNVGWPISEENGKHFVNSPDGHKVFIEQHNPENSATENRVKRVTLGCSDLKRSIAYWHGILDMEVFAENMTSVILGFGSNQACLELRCVGDVDHATAFGRIAFSCPRELLSDIESRIRQSGETVITSLVKLETPGKSAVEVVILADPDGHEICFVGDNAFRELSQTDQNAEEHLNTALLSDKSEEWFEKKGKSKATAE